MQIDITGDEGDPQITRIAAFHSRTARCRAGLGSKRAIAANPVMTRLKNGAQQIVIARASPLAPSQRIHSCPAIARGFGQFRKGKGKAA
jgi:hypothetical protein